MRQRSPVRILIVDDNRDILDLVQRLLTTSGYDVITARDGREALQQDAAATPDMLILYVNLPHFSGWDVCRRVKSKRSVPVLLLTVRAEQADIERSRDAGADEHLAKPFEIGQFLSRVELLVNRYHGASRTQFRGR
jgi:DNA-binding response OmpR family regulator